MLLSLELAQEELYSPPENEAIATLISSFGTALKAYKEVLAGEATGQIDSEVANEVMENITENLLLLIEDTLELDFEQMVDELEASGGDADEIPLETFGEAFTGLLVTETPSYEEGIDQVAETTGIDPDALVDYANDRAMPSAQEAAAICGCFMSCQDANVMEAIMDTVDQSEYDTAEMNRYDELTAEFSALAHRAAVKERNEAISSRLRNIQREADSMLANRVITPAEYRELTPLPESFDAQDLPEFSAYFSGLCQHEGSSAELEIDRMEHTISFLKNRGTVVNPMFAEFSQQSYSPAPVNDAQSLDEYRKTYGYG